jgi:hypothetical protein
METIQPSQELGRPQGEQGTRPFTSNDWHKLAFCCGAAAALATYAILPGMLPDLQPHGDTKLGVREFEDLAAEYKIINPKAPDFIPVPAASHDGNGRIVISSENWNEEEDRQLGKRLEKVANSFEEPDNRAKAYSRINAGAKIPVTLPDGSTKWEELWDPEPLKKSWVYHEAEYYRSHWSLALLLGGFFSAFLAIEFVGFVWWFFLERVKELSRGLCGPRERV